jgi:hypothetical protein
MSPLCDAEHVLCILGVRSDLPVPPSISMDVQERKNIDAAAFVR